jgi:hypothetical protein
MPQLSDNLTHVLALVALLATCVLLIVFGHGYVNSDYVFGTTTTLAGALFGYRFGTTGGMTPETAVKLAQDNLTTQAQETPPMPEPTPIIFPTAPPPHA